MNAFLTGSYVYGKVTEKSDIDLVIRCSEETKRLLQTLADDESNRHHKTVRGIRFGDLNIIACTDDETYSTWILGTKRLFDDATKDTQHNQFRNPIDSDTAKRVFRFLRGFNVETILDSPEIREVFDNAQRKWVSVSVAEYEQLKGGKLPNGNDRITT